MSHAERYSGPKTRVKRSTPEPEYVDGFFAGRQRVLRGGCNQKEKPESLGHLMGYFSGSTLSNGLAVTCNMVYIPLLTPQKLI